jgi:hypothetical protein
MNTRQRNRKLLGAVAGVKAGAEAIKYAQDKGLFVLVQSGDSAKIAAAADGFTPQEW